MDQVGIVAILLGGILAVVVLWRWMLRTEQRLANAEYGLHSLRAHLIHAVGKSERYQPRPLLYEPDLAVKEL